MDLDKLFRIMAHYKQMIHNFNKNQGAEKGIIAGVLFLKTSIDCIPCTCYGGQNSNKDQIEITRFQSQPDIKCA